MSASSLLRSSWLLLLLLPWLPADAADGPARSRPNILLAIADDWGFPHAGIYGDPVVRTPTFDRLAREGVLFRHAYVSSPSCTPSRSALLTGQHHWRLEEAANLWSTLRREFATYPELLAADGYFIGHSRKAWGPGRLEPGGRSVDPSGPVHKDFGSFLSARPAGSPFCFWFGSPDPHRPYVPGTGVGRGMDLDRIRVPGALPDDPVVRSDIADYYFEVERFDREVGEALALLEASGELDNTIVVMTGDHGMPFPRAKSNLYDLGTRVPLAVRWGGVAGSRRVVDDFVSLVDLAPTFLEIAGLPVPGTFTGRSLLPLLRSDRSGRVDPARDHVVFGKERHVPSQERGNLAGYPGRGLRTADFLYLRNHRPELWPNGIADGAASEKGNAFADCDDGPTKAFVVAHRGDARGRRYFELAFGLRPAEELYDLRSDPDQLVNVASEAGYQGDLLRLRERLTRELKALGDPRETGDAVRFEEYPYYGGRLGPGR